MTTSRSGLQTWAAVVTGFALFGCSNTHEVLESTTVEVPASGGTVSSADGRFTLHFSAALAAQEVTIETVYDVGHEALVSKVYLVRAQVPRVRAVEATYALQDLATPHTKALATVDADGYSSLSTVLDEEQGVLRTEDVAVDGLRFAVVELGFRNGSCQVEACNAHCTYCDSDAASCVPQPGRCDLSGACRLDIPSCEGGLEGWDDPPATGAAFIIDSLAIAEAHRGFDLDGACALGSCVDNRMALLSWLLDSTIRQGLFGELSLTLIELAGLDPTPTGEDPSLTLRLYRARDVDSPFFPADNFRVPPGGTDCCEFLLEPASLSGVPPMARSRAPARVSGGVLRTLAPTAFSPTSFFLGVPAIEPPTPVSRLERVFVRAEPSANLDRLEAGLLGAVVPASTLAALDALCTAPRTRCPVVYPEGSSMLDVAAAVIGSPDVDLDGDGLECLLDTDGDGRVDRCCDGEADACGACTRVVAPVREAEPASCAEAPQIADGYSIAYDFTAVRASILGVAE